MSLLTMREMSSSGMPRQLHAQPARGGLVCWLHVHPPAGDGSIFGGDSAAQVIASQVVFCSDMHYRMSMCLRLEMHCTVVHRCCLELLGPCLRHGHSISIRESTVRGEQDLSA